MVNAKQLNRIHKANMILATVKKNTAEVKEVPEHVLISHVCLEFGAGRKYVKEIVDDLVNVGKILRTEKGLVFPDELKP